MKAASTNALGALFDVRSALLPLATLLLVVFLVLPVPAFVLDIGFITNIMISLAVLMVALNASKPLDFSSFPTVLLFATLLRLGLNVASTRVVLVQGHEGGDAAGHVIEAFGSMLIGGDYVVGLFVFAILMIINMVVITKGAGRVSEVSARFTLDALPGKQMAIDADLGAGLITPEEAKQRRVDVATEADFYGSMDGASKFVKGDAIAGVLILVINIVGGIVLGIASHGLSIGEAASTYTMLAIGDALVAQVPALLLSIAAAAIVTRVSSPFDLPGQIASQFGSHKAWMPVAAILTILGILPGMPHMVILPAAAVAGYFAYRFSRPVPEIDDSADDPAPNPNVIHWSDVSDEAMLGIEVGYALTPLVDERRDAPLMKRVTGIRKQLSKELGFVIPLVRIKDDLTLDPNAYRITIGGTVIGEDVIWPEDMLAIDSGDIDEEVEGRICKDPTFGMDARWISPDKRPEAIVSGYTVVDASTVLATHLNHMIRLNAAQLFGMDETRMLLDNLKDRAPELVEGLTPKPLSLFAVSAVCRALLIEGVPLKDFRRLCSAMVEATGDGTVDIPLVVERVRQRIGSIIIQSLVPVSMPLPVVTLDPELEGLIGQSIKLAGDASFPIEPGLGQRILSAIEESSQRLMLRQQSFALVTSPAARKALSDLLRPRFPDTPVLSFRELPDDKPVEVIATVGGKEAPAPALQPQAKHSFTQL
ncbi:flagellar biosynthesis protein FlhA [Novosphingopyxis sp.]|uniref:flagellar biosynthesis protein FlhA n=1 Tax=Novosphingopyxis sp. TaxID=2709690 RepID=UPI003B5BCE9F